MNIVLVVCALLQDDTGRFLVIERPMNKPYGGYFEFPGGKVESFEKVEDALKRELKEEIGYDLLNDLSPFTFFTNQVEDNQLVVLCFISRIGKSFTPTLLEGQGSFAWVTVEEMAGYKILPDNKTIIAHLKKVTPHLR